MNVAKIVFGLSIFFAGISGVQAKPPLKWNGCTGEWKLTGTVGPATLDSIERAIVKTQKKKCSSLLLLINTPGGSLQSTRLIVESILNSPIPILCLVFPAGAHAGSAGAIILQACHINGAMVTTNLGAATPIMGSGKDISKDLKAKMINDTVSLLKGLTTRYGRNSEFGEKIITEAKALSAKEAYKLGAIDIVAQTKQDFLTRAMGRNAPMQGDRKVSVQIGKIYTIEADLRQNILEVVTDPQIAYMMLMGSLGLLYFEITHPGLVVPGVVGGIGIIVALISLHKLDVTWGGLLLLLLGLGLLMAEAFVPSFGMLGLGGVVAFFLGSLFLFDPASGTERLPLSLILPTTFILGLAMVGIAYLAFSTRGRKLKGDFSELNGMLAEVVKLEGSDACQGLVFINGENWHFECPTPLALKDKVWVRSHEGLTLKVETQESVTTENKKS